MNMQWIQAAAGCPIVEFHDVRTEKAKQNSYLAILDELAVSGAQELGRFTVANQPDRVVLLRGFANMPTRRRALEAFHAMPDWAHRRANAANMVRNSEVLLTRSITPTNGLFSPIPDEQITLLISELRFAEQIGSYHLWLRLLLRKAGMMPVATFATLEAVNDVPAVPVVKNRSHHIALIRGWGRVPQLPPELRNMLRYPPEILALEPALSLVW